MIKTEIVSSPLSDKPYIRRYMLWFTKRLCINIIYGDTEFVHSHPWNYFTLILWGGYDEKLIINGNEVTKRRYPGYFSFRKYSTYHRLCPIGSCAVTLFYRGKPKVGYTNFLINGKKIRDAKYWLMSGLTKKDLKEVDKNSTLKKDNIC